MFMCYICLYLLWISRDLLMCVYYIFLYLLWISRDLLMFMCYIFYIYCGSHVTC